MTDDTTALRDDETIEERAKVIANSLAVKEDWSIGSQMWNAARIGAFKALSAPPAQAADEAVVACADCRLAYCDDGWADFVVPHDVWALLTATDNASLLCANCMVRRAVQLGITAVGCFTSGPFAQDFKALATQARGVGEAERQLLRRWLDAADKGLWRDRAGLSLARHPVADDTRAMIAAALRTPATGGGS